MTAKPATQESLIYLQDNTIDLVGSAIQLNKQLKPIIFKQYLLYITSRPYQAVSKRKNPAFGQGLCHRAIRIVELRCNDRLDLGSKNLRA